MPAPGATIRKGYLPGGAGQIHYRAAGDAGPHLFLFHLTPISSRQFEACLPHLAPHVQAYALDTPGYGNSDPPPASTTIEDYADRLLVAINAVTDGPVAFGGFSTGSVIALEIARRIPARVTHMVLATTPLMSKDELRHMAATNVGVPAMMQDGSYVLKVWQGRQGIWGQDFDMTILNTATADILTNYTRYHWGLEAVIGCDIAPLLRAVRCPTLFLSGEFDTHVAHNKASAEAVQGSRYEILPGASAPLSATAPAAYARRVVSFVKGTA